ncbi:MAG: SMC-Scp complex subunit ScpB [Actinomycetota bacterium]
MSDEPMPAVDPLEERADREPSAVTEPRGAGDLARSIEALLFVSDEPVAASVLAGVLETDRRAVDRACEELAAALEARGSGVVLRNVAGGWRLFTHPDTAPIVERFVLSSRQARLTKAALETLAIVAYKQPVTRHQVSSVRGVNSDGVLRALTERELVVEVGREESPGRPVLYGTSPAFLERLGLPSLTSLPSLAPLLGEVDEVDPGRDAPPAPADGAEDAGPVEETYGDDEPDAGAADGAEGSDGRPGGAPGD